MLGGAVVDSELSTEVVLAPTKGRGTAGALKAPSSTPGESAVPSACGSTPKLTSTEPLTTP